MEADTVSFILPAANDWKALAPEILLTLSGTLLIVLGAFLRRRPRVVNCLAVSIFFLNMMYVFMFESYFYKSGFNGMLNVPTYTWFLFFCGFLSSVMGARWLSKSPAPHAGEFYGILAITVAALSVFTRSMHLMLTFVALEASAICFYVLIAWARKQPQNLGSSIRYLILSGASGAFFLLGIAFIYGAGLKNGIDFLYYYNFFEAINSKLFYAGLIFVLSGIFFKLSAFPFQFWAPDVYQGAPTPITAFMAVASKAAAFTVLYSMLRFTMLDSRMIFGLALVAAAGIIIGNLGGLVEKNTKRLLGFSGIANAGYMMVLMVSILSASATGFIDDRHAISAIKFYLFAYLLGVYGVMFVQNLHTSENDSKLELADFNGLWKKSPLSTGVLATGLASLAGIPPTAGFFAKVLVLILAIASGFHWLAILLVVGSAASIYYYFRWMRAPFADNAATQFEPSEASGPIMLAITFGSVVMGIFVFAYLF